MVLVKYCLLLFYSVSFSQISFADRMLLSQKMLLSYNILTRSMFQFPPFRICQVAQVRIMDSISNRSVSTVHQKDHRIRLRSCHSLITKHSFDIRKSSPILGISCSYYSSVKNVFFVKTEENYAVVYRFPYIVKLHLLAKMQLNFAALCSVTSIVVNILYMTQKLSVDVDMVKEAFFASFVAVMMMCIVNTFSRKIVAVVSLHEVTGMIQVSHLTFMGKRKDVDVHQQDIAPLLGAKDPKKAFKKFKRHSSSDVLYLSVKYGGILNKEAFAHIFGTVKL